MPNKNLTQHQPVLLTEALRGLAIVPDGVYIDGTFGRGGHSREILAQLGDEGRLLAFDKDPKAIETGQQEPFDDPRFCIVHDSFTALKHAVEEREWTGKVRGILLDLGVSSPQLDNAERGFSFTKDGPLDMRMNPQKGMDAASWLNQADVEDITRVLREYGEERYAWRLANAIVRARAESPLTRTTQLADVIARAYPASRERRRIHPATRSFQGIRIFINRELDDLQDCLAQSLDLLAPGGRLCVISFHSLEDRIVKRYIQKQSSLDDYPPDLPIQHIEDKRRMQRVGGLIRPSATEIANNPRARSARLRIAEKIK